MKRKDFINKIINLGLWAVLALLVLMLGRKVTAAKDCSSCPEYANCTGIAGCKFDNREDRG